jgi:hypothetical protein
MTLVRSRARSSRVAKGSALTFIKTRKRAAWHQLNMGMGSLGWMIGLVLGFGVTALLICLAYDRYSRP